MRRDPRIDAMKQLVHDAARRARAAAATLASTTSAVKDAALHAMADALEAGSGEILAANALDVDAARAGGTSEDVIDRLSLDEQRIRAFADGLRDIAALPDPI